MADSPANLKAPAPIAAIASWLLPGAGYWLIGQKSRALVVGATVIGLYLAGLLIGGVRVVDVPGFNAGGNRILADAPGRPWILLAAPWQEIKAKPWSIAQILAGPIGLASGVASVWSAGPASTAGGSNRGAEPIALVSHTPVNEAGTLYTSVAGMLNLLAIIDAAHRANRREET